MKCKIGGCETEAMYKNDQVCQKHYFRKMRTGSYELSNRRRYKVQNPAGYIKIYEPSHELANSGGYVYEHRFVYYESGKQVDSCEICGCVISWADCHIDHIDQDVTNNKLQNLRPLCRGCNVFRGRPFDCGTKNIIEIDGIRLSAMAWARRDDVCVTGQTIARRKAKGFSDYEAVYGERKTHKKTKTKKLEAKTDSIRIAELG